MKHMEALAACNQQKAWEIIEETHLVDCWKEIGAEVHLIGSLRMGLLMLHRDIDFHIYSEPLRVEDSFRAMAGLLLSAHSHFRRKSWVWNTIRLCCATVCGHTKIFRHGDACIL